MSGSMLRQLPPSGAPTVRPQLQSRTLRLSVKAAHEGGSSTSRRELLKGQRCTLAEQWQSSTLVASQVVVASLCCGNIGQTVPQTSHVSLLCLSPVRIALSPDACSRCEPR